MINLNNPIIICGSGNSIKFLNSRYNSNGFKHGLEPKLEQIIKSNYSIGLNYWFQFGCETTFNMSGDWQFYLDNSRQLKKVPMIIASEDGSLKNKNISHIYDNTILLPHSSKYFGINSWVKNNKGKMNGFYSRQLIGMFSLTLAIALGFKEIYLLGYDCCEVNGQTHFYQGVVDLNDHRDIYVNGKLKDRRYKFKGVGKKPKGDYETSTYNHVNHINNKWYAPYEIETKKIKIYNVSPNSVINTFPKISYDTFFKQIDNNNINQNKARQEIKDFVIEKLKN